MGVLILERLEPEQVSAYGEWLAVGDTLYWPLQTRIAGESVHLLIPAEHWNEILKEVAWTTPPSS